MDVVIDARIPARRAYARKLPMIRTRKNGNPLSSELIIPLVLSISNILEISRPTDVVVSKDKPEPKIILTPKAIKPYKNIKAFLYNPFIYIVMGNL